MTERPRTCTPRGVCKYFKEPRGCFAGDSCKFLHSDESGTLQLTPYDRAKTCRYYAAGFCKREDTCWFLHVKSPHDDTLDEELCSICFERPVTFGLLSGCSHVFCIKCIRLWRDPAGKTLDVKWSGATKSCPMCRAPSKFITPSSLYFKQGDPRKDQAMETYRLSMSRVPCRYFTQSKTRNPSRPLCPFGKDCFYQHLNVDGTPFVFRHGIKRSMRVYRQQSLRTQTPVAGPSRSLDSDDLLESFEDLIYGVATNINHALFTRDGLNLLSEMFNAGLVNDEEESDEDDGDDSMPELELLDDGTESDIVSTNGGEPSRDDDKGESDNRPFVTDGRGRVIGANDRLASYDL